MGWWVVRYGGRVDWIDIYPHWWAENFKSDHTLVVIKNCETSIENKEFTKNDSKMIV